MKIILTFLLLLPLVNIAQEKTKEIITYEKGDYYIEYPSDWFFNDSKTHQSEFYLYPENSESSEVFTKNIVLTKQDLTEFNGTISTYKKTVEKQVSQILSNHIIILSEIKNKNGLDFHRIIAHGKIEKNKFELVLYTWILNKKLYTLSFMSLDYLEKNRESMKVMDSFQLKS